MSRVERIAAVLMFALVPTASAFAQDAGPQNQMGCAECICSCSNNEQEMADLETEIERLSLEHKKGLDSVSAALGGIKQTGDSAAARTRSIEAAIVTSSDEIKALRSSSASLERWMTEDKARLQAELDDLKVELQRVRKQAEAAALMLAEKESEIVRLEKELPKSAYVFVERWPPGLTVKLKLKLESAADEVDLVSEGLLEFKTDRPVKIIVRGRIGNQIVKRRTHLLKPGALVRVTVNGSRVSLQK